MADDKMVSDYLEDYSCQLQEAMYFLARELVDRAHNEQQHGRAAIPVYTVEQWTEIALKAAQKKLTQ